MKITQYDKCSERDKFQLFLSGREGHSLGDGGRIEVFLEEVMTEIGSQGEEEFMQIKN